MEVLNSGQIPEYIKEGRLLLLRKKGQKFEKPEDTRPIVILNYILKIIARVLFNRLKQARAM
jgi:hypothetical protein